METQYIVKASHGDTFYYKDKEMTIRHREDGPAIEWSNGYKEWLINDRLHREDGPAVVDANGYKAWYINDRRHREDGPAIEWCDGSKSWFIDGRELTEEEFNKRTNPKKAIVEEIKTLLDKLITE